MKDRYLNLTIYIVVYMLQKKRFLKNNYFPIQMNCEHIANPKGYFVISNERLLMLWIFYFYSSENFLFEITQCQCT